MTEGTTGETAGRVLVVDDEPGVREALDGILRDEGFEVTTVESGEDALAAFTERSFDAVLLDIWLPGKDGLEVLMELRERAVEAEVVMISGHGTIETAVRATKLGAFDFVEKPLSLEKTLLVLRNALRQRRLEQRNRRLLEQLTRDTEILGRSETVEKLRAAVATASGVDAPVLILGERGSGRETVARRIHAAGPRSGEPFVDVPCAALGEKAAAEALFGAGDDEAGGRLGLARGGSIFLEDVESLAGALQERLAAWLGGPSGAAADVRVLASTGPGVSGIEPSLRQRLDVIRIQVPPLRDHREDIQLLVERFMRDLSREYAIPPKRLEPQTLAALRAHDWPGNLRELRNLVERVLLLAPDDVVGVGDLPAELGGAVDAPADLYREFGSLAEGLESFERYYVRRVLEECRGEVEPTARRLGIRQDTLKRKIGKLGLAQKRD